MIFGYGEPYTGTQVETPETAKGNVGGCHRDR